MAQPFLGEIRTFSFPFAPKGWALCQGQVVSIQQNQALFSLLGTQYGGNGSTNFMLPDLRGRASLGQGQAQGGSYVQGSVGGAEAVTLTVNQVPMHGHQIQASATTPATNVPSGSQALATVAIYAPAGGTLTAMSQDALGSPGAQAHQNMQPSLVLNYCIALQGVFPSRN